MRSSIAASAARRRRRVFAAIALSSLSSIAALPSKAGPGAEAQMLRLVSDVRAQRGLAGLSVDPVLARLAQARSAEMARARRIWHDRALPWKIGGWNEFGENVGVGMSAASLHDVLMQSPSHRRNILERDYRRIGIGITVFDGTLYIAQLFSDRAVHMNGRVTSASSTTGPSREPRAPRLNFDRLADSLPWVIVQLARAMRAVFLLGMTPV